MSVSRISMRLAAATLATGLGLTAVAVIDNAVHSTVQAGTGAGWDSVKPTSTTAGAGWDSPTPTVALAGAGWDSTPIVAAVSGAGWD